MFSCTGYHGRRCRQNSARRRSHRLLPGRLKHSSKRMQKNLLCSSTTAVDYVVCAWTSKKNPISPDPKKVKKIKDLPHPTNHCMARSFAGAINYYNDLMPNLAPLMLPIFEATKQGPFKWSEECQQNFEKIKKELCKMPCIYMPDFSKPMHLFTDAAARQFLSYCVQQKHEKFNKYLPIAWGSHKFSNHD